VQNIGAYYESRKGNRNTHDLHGAAYRGCRSEAAPSYVTIKIPPSINRADTDSG
jgi:hypothetical protein